MPSKRPDTPLAETPNAEFSYTKKYSESKKKIEKNIPTNVKVSNTGTATAKPYEKKFVPADAKRTKALIVDGSGKTVKTATSKSGVKTGNERLYREFKRDSTDTMNRRNKTANFRNVNTGVKKNLTASDLKTLKDLGKIKNS